MKLSIIIVNYNGGVVLPACLSAVYRETTDLTFEVVVVDNASTDGSVEEIARRFPQVRLIRNAQNIGFAAANNIAIRQSAGEFVLLLNPDTEVLDGAIQRTVAFMEADARIGIAGCKLLYADRTLQPSVRGYPTILGALLDASFLHLLLPPTKLVRERGISTFDYSRAEEVDWVIGAFFMTRRALLETLGPLDEQFWMYGEEVDFCRRAKNAGLQTWFLPDAVVVHHWGGMTAYNLRVIVWLHIGVKLYADKHLHGVRKYLIMYLRYAGAALRVLVYPVAACATFDKSLFTKAGYYAVALHMLLTRHWRYDHRHTGTVIPWTEYV